MRSSIRLFSRSRTIERAYSSNRYTQCKNCWGYGHVAPRCPSTDPICPICSLNHTRAMHRCPNPTCPGGGNSKAVPGCCSSSPPRCVNCGAGHTAIHRDCESGQSPPPLRRSTAATEIIPPPPTGDEMDTETDDRVVLPPPSPTRSLHSVFEMATPRARRTTILPASVRPNQGSSALPPAEQPSPSPMSRTASGLARYCSTTIRRGQESRSPLPLRTPSHSFSTTASGAGMCSFHCSGPLLNWPNLLPLWPCKTLRSTGANYPLSDCFLPSPPPPPVAASPALPFTFIVLFCLLFLSFLGFLTGATSWLLTFSPLMAFLIPPRLDFQLSTPTAPRVA